MPSNKNIVQNAVSKAISSDETIDLLLISNILDDINGEEVGEDKDYGMNYNYLYIGMSGRRMVDQMNSNWRATDAQFLANKNALDLRIISNQIKEIKVEDNIAYFTTDGKTWKSLLTTWGKITGNITEQADLKQALDNKVGLDQFNALTAQVSSNSSNIITINGNVTSLTNSVSNILNVLNASDGVLVRLDNAERLLAKKITSNSVLEIRTINGTALEFTTNGTEWHPVSSAGQVEWGDVIGDIENQADLMVYIDKLEKLIKSVDDDLLPHLENYNNPHQVTAEQIGLGNVNNTSDTDKPLSTDQKAYIDNQIEILRQQIVGGSKFQSLKQTDYEAITTKDNTTIYYINDLS